MIHSTHVFRWPTLAAMNDMRNDDLVDRQRYPIGQPRSTIYKTVVAAAQRQLADDGCLVLREFITPLGRAWFEAETEQVAPACGTANRW